MILLNDTINTPGRVIDHAAGYGKGQEDTLHTTERQTLTGNQSGTVQKSGMSTYWVYIVLAAILFIFNYNLGKK